MAFLKKYSFDGIVLEFTNGWSIDYMEKYIKLVTVLKEDFKASGYVLGSVLAAQLPGYEIKKVIEQVDFISVNTFDYNGPWHESPPQTPTGHGASLTDIQASMTIWGDQIDKAQMSKLLISLPFYGHTWKLADPTDHSVGAKASDKGPAQPFTNSSGLIGWNELMLKMKDGGLIMEEDKVAGSVYFYKDDLWATAEDEATIKAKTNWATTEGFGGVTVRAINYDDFNDQFDQLPKQKGTDKSLVAIGGFTHASEIVAALDNPSLFSKNSMAFLKKYSFDGIVLEFTNGWSIDYMEKYIKLVTVLK
ncbi:unnamed protein product, partial [Oppiella nova]